MTRRMVNGACEYCESHYDTVPKIPHPTFHAIRQADEMDVNHDGLFGAYTALYSR